MYMTTPSSIASPGAQQADSVMHCSHCCRVACWYSNDLPVEQHLACGLSVLCSRFLIVRHAGALLSWQSHRAPH